MRHSIFEHTVGINATLAGTAGLYIYNAVQGALTRFRHVSSVVQGVLMHVKTRTLDRSAPTLPQPLPLLRRSHSPLQLSGWRQEQGLGMDRLHRCHRGKTLSNKTVIYDDVIGNCTRQHKMR